MSGAEVLTVEELDRRVEAILRRAGLNAVQAGALARVIVAGERDACKSHGIYRIDGILRTIKAGQGAAAGSARAARSRRLRRSSGWTRGAASPTPRWSWGAPVLAERARRLGVARWSINDCTHFSALWPEVEMLTGRGPRRAGDVPELCHRCADRRQPAAARHQSLRLRLAAPGRAALRLRFRDLGTARGEIELHRRAGKRLPEGWAIDADGRPTTDPEAALAGAMLPFGGHKGSAIGTMIELLAGIMIGDLTSREALDVSRHARRWRRRMAS